MFTLEFEAWICHKDELDIEEPTEFFSKSFDTPDAAKNFIINDCFEWKDGEWDGCYITLSFQNGPNIFNDQGVLVSKCIMTNWDDAEFEWEEV